MITDYGKIYNLGTHRDIAGILDGPVWVEEKIDGSQFSFRVDSTGQPRFRSRRQEVLARNPGQFAAGVASVFEIAHLLEPGFTYRGEYLRAPRHNVLEYKRIPKRHIMIWEIEDTQGTRALPPIRSELASRAGLETVDVLKSYARVSGLEEIQTLLSGESALGGRMEGLVIKDDFGRKAKVVAASFRETKKIPKARPTDSDFVNQLGRQYCTPMRWEKALQRLRDEGKLTGTLSDIGPLLREVQLDMQSECEEAIKAELFNRSWKQIARAGVEKLPDWYKEKLATDASA